MRFLSSFIAVMGCVFAGFSQSSDDSISKAEFDEAYFRSYWDDAKDIACSPFHLTTSKVVAYSTVAAGTLGLFACDVRVKNFVQDHRSQTTDNVSKYVFEPYGRGVYSVGLLACFYLHGTLWHNEQSTRVALNGLKAFCFAGVAIQIPKYVFRRERPFQSPDNAHSWFKGLSNVSFASGHTCAAFAVSTIIAMEYKHTVWVPIVAYSLAGCTGLSRINDNKHWASDVFMGAAIGYGIAALIHNKNNWKLRVTPIVGAGSVGMVFGW